MEKNETILEKKTLIKKEVAALIGEICDTTYGVVGLTPVKSILESINVILKKEDYVNGINIFKIKDKYVIDIHVIVSYGVKITEVVNEVSRRCKYFLEKEYGQVFRSINVYVDELRDLN